MTWGRAYSTASERYTQRVIRIKRIFLSHTINADTPTYGGRTHAELTKSADMKNGDAANNTVLSMSLHTGTHVDMPKHFYNNGQTVKDFPADFWFFSSPLFVDVTPDGHVIKNELISQLINIKNKDRYDCIIVRTGFDRYNPETLIKNPGFDESLADYIRKEFKHVRLLGFDTMSVSSFAERMEGRKAHRAFLNPENPIILLEDMKLDDKDIRQINRLIILPLLVEDSDGLPCTVIGEIG